MNTMVSGAIQTVLKIRCQPRAWTVSDWHTVLMRRNHLNGLICLKCFHLQATFRLWGDCWYYPFEWLNFNTTSATIYKKKERKKEINGGWRISLCPLSPNKRQSKENKSYRHSTWNRNGHDPENPYCTGRDITEYGHSVRLSIHPHSKTGTNSVVWRPPPEKGRILICIFSPPSPHKDCLDH